MKSQQVGKKEDYLSSLNKKEEETKTTQNVTNDIDFNHYSDDEEPNTVTQDSLVKASDNTEKNKPKGLKDLFGDDKKPTTAKQPPKKGGNDSRNLQQGRQGELQKPNFKSNPNRQNFDSKVPSTTSQGGLQKPDFKGNANKQNSSLPVNQGSQRTRDELKKPEFKGAIQKTSDTAAKTTKDYEITTQEDIEKRQFVNKSGKDNNFVAINQNEDLYLKKMKEMGVEEIEYSVPKEEGKDGEKRFVNNNRDKRPYKPRDGNYRGGNNYNSHTKKAEVEVDEDGFQTVGDDRKAQKKPYQKRYYNNEGGNFVRRKRNDSDDDEKNFETALKEENRDNEENYEERKAETEPSDYNQYKKQRKINEKDDAKKHKWNNDPDVQAEKPIETPKPVQTTGVIKVPKNATKLGDLFSR